MFSDLFNRQLAIVFSGFIFLIFGFMLATPVAATTVISPVLELEADPGETQKGIVKIYNETANNLALVSSVEAFTAGDENGQPKYLAPEEKDIFINWFQVDQESILLKPGQVAIVPFQVTIPKNATPGGYYAVIFWQTIEDQPKNAPLVVSSKVGTLVFLTVKGDLTEKGELVEFSTQPSGDYLFSLPISFVVRFNNSGNIHLKPSGEIILTNWFGQKQTLVLNPETRNVLPASTRRFEVVWGKSLQPDNFFKNFWLGLQNDFKALSFGRYQATLNLSYSAQAQPLSQTLTFWLFPWRLILGGLLLLILIIFFFWFNHKINKLKKSARTNKNQSMNNTQDVQKQQE